MTASVSDVIKANPPAVDRKETLLRSRITPVFGGFFGQALHKVRPPLPVGRDGLDRSFVHGATGSVEL